MCEREDWGKELDNIVNGSGDSNSQDDGTFEVGFRAVHENKNYEISEDPSSYKNDK